MRLSLLLLLVSACAPIASGRCNPTNCMGCCDARSTCQLGQTASACGNGGATCGSCGLGLICSSGVCGVPSASVNTGAGGGSTSSGTGGGTSSRGGGAAGRAWQELTSGTRLRAIHLTGADGSKAPLPWSPNVSAIFWDSQLSLYCTPVAQDLPSPVCVPLGLAWGTGEGDEFVDPSCMIHAARGDEPTSFNAAFSAAGLPISTITHVKLTDTRRQHTYFTAMRVPLGAPRYSRSSESSACIASGFFEYPAWATGSSVPATTFAAMAVTRE